MILRLTPRDVRDLRAMHIDPEVDRTPEQSLRAAEIECRVLETALESCERALRERERSGLRTARLLRGVIVALLIASAFLAGWGSQWRDRALAGSAWTEVAQ